MLNERHPEREQQGAPGEIRGKTSVTAAAGISIVTKCFILFAFVIFLIVVVPNLLGWIILFIRRFS